MRLRTVLLSILFSLALPAAADPASAGCPADLDSDGICDDVDNCPPEMINPSAWYNPLQEDGDSDGRGDVCDNCPPGGAYPSGWYNPIQADGDSDGRGDVCDNCSAIANGPDAYAPGLGAVSQCDRDSDGYGNACDGDFPGTADLFVTPADSPSYLVALMAFFPPAPGEHDMTCNGFMTPGDNPFYLAQLVRFFVGPSGRSCAGIVPGACPP